ncbi:MAG: hypothetical protein Q4F72_01640 [Desulfovibrionaceae bacterium]|nr:hypothetical protein [Desulfovibrionaceae bacterium]
MSAAGTPDWGGVSRFFIPNEDADTVRQALDVLPAKPARPAFVLGSGMLLLDVLGGCPNARAAAVDISADQLALFDELGRALEESADCAELRRWFETVRYPALRAHYLARGQEYPLEKVWQAMRGRFAIRFFDSERALEDARAACRNTTAVRADMAAWLTDPASEYDFVHLSNIADYLDPAVLPDLFAACRERRAPVFLVLTMACADPAALERAWKDAGYAVHPASLSLARQNRALGALKSDRPWLRTGRVVLLVRAKGA